MALFRAAAAAIVFSFSGCEAASNLAIECVEYGVDYTGYDILVLSGVANSNQCMESCTQEEACQYWSWDSESSSCFLKSAAAILGRTPKESIISGPKSCNVDDSCFEAGVDYVGFDLLRIEGQDIPSAAACQKLCELEPQCAFFSYKATNRGCYLKTTGALVGSIQDADVTSGPRICQTLADEEIDIPTQSCAEGSVEYRGHNVNITQNVGSAPHCQQLCAANSVCSYWTWDRKKNTCYEKDSTANEAAQSGPHTLGMVSGEKYCVPLNPGCQLMDVAFQGKVIRELRNSTFEACQANCQSLSECKYWTFTSRKSCQLKDSTPFGYIASLGSISGPKHCPNNDLCMEQADYVGHNIEAIQDGSVPSANSCRALCRKTEGCELWTWVESTNNCYLKSADALLGKTNGLSSIRRYSGPRECFMHYGCIDINAAYLNANATKIKNVNNYKECEEQCTAASSCLVWTYLSNSRICLLNENEDEKISFDGAMSGRKDCTTTGSQDCFYPGVKYDEIEMAFKEAVLTASECQLECAKNLGCLTFTFEESVGCYLYNKTNEQMAQYPTKFPTVVSGPSVCSTSSSTPTTTLATYTAVSTDCARLCSENHACTSWTFNPKLLRANCTLRAAVASTNTTSVNPGIFDGYKYVGTVLAEGDADSAEACRTACISAGHSVWNYYADTKKCEMLGSEAALLRSKDIRATCGTNEDPTVYNGLQFNVELTVEEKFSEKCENDCLSSEECRAFSNTAGHCVSVKGSMPDLKQGDDSFFVKFRYV